MSTFNIIKLTSECQVEFTEGVIYAIGSGNVDLADVPSCCVVKINGEVPPVWVGDGDVIDVDINYDDCEDDSDEPGSLRCTMSGPSCNDEVSLIPRRLERQLLSLRRMIFSRMKKVK